MIVATRIQKVVEMIELIDFWDMGLCAFKYESMHRRDPVLFDINDGCQRPIIPMWFRKDGGQNGSGFHTVKIIHVSWFMEALIFLPKRKSRKKFARRDSSSNLPWAPQLPNNENRDGLEITG
ncbi:predicted protein [Coccidioides posadasii str. Silveira]|uniref:Predicted protein n=1 Tax=Coccidioides posadasii (strain RMSCC 757 / Silveira) TaxID=443226 RepID=E9D6K5_COCPS|nr:predicted protein [Coccidioides posadasii str. Silveira]